MSLDNRGASNPIESKPRTTIPLKVGDRVVATTLITERAFNTNSVSEDHVHCFTGDYGTVIDTYAEVNNIKHYEYPTVRFDNSGTATLVEYNASLWGDFTKNGSNEVIKVNK